MDTHVARAVARGHGLRLLAWLWRFRTLQLASSGFGRLPPGLVLSRPFYARRLYLDLSRDSGQRYLFLEGARFVPERAVLRRLLRPGMTVVDVGANVGYYALLFRQAVGPRGRVVCLEPDPGNLRELRRNVERNHLHNVEVVAAAAGEAAGEIRFSSGLNGSVSAAGDLRVPAIRLDDLSDGPVDLIKIDVEGYEAAVLRGAAGLIERRRPTLFIELHPALLTADSHHELVSALRASYSRISSFERPAGGLRAKLLARYLGLGAIAPVRDLPGLLAECAAGRRAQPFWVVCER